MVDNIKLSSIEMIEKHLYINEDGAYKDVHDSVSNVADCMIEFAKYHVKQALTIIFEEAKHGDEEHQLWLKEFFDKYPLENIK